MSKKAAELAGQMAQMLEVIGVLEARLADLKKLAGGKKKRRAPAAAPDPNQPPRAPRPPNVWIQFTQRVERLVREAGIPFARAVDSKKFCKELKDGRSGYGWSDEEIIAARRDWDPPTPVHSVGGEEAEPASALASVTQEVNVCPTCRGVIEGDAEAHRACVISVAEAAKAAGADPMKAVDAWSESVSRVVMPIVARPVAIPSLERSRTPLRRPSGTTPLAVPQLQRPPPLTGKGTPSLNSPSEELMIEDME